MHCRLSIMRCVYQTGMEISTEPINIFICIVVPYITLNIVSVVIVIGTQNGARGEVTLFIQDITVSPFTSINPSGTL